MSLLEIARQAAGLARRHGADEAAAAAFRSRQVEVAWRDGRLERISEATTRGLGLELYVGGRYAAVSSSDLRPEALDAFVGQAVALARALAPDPHRRLPDPEHYRGRAELDLELHDPFQPRLDAVTRRGLAEALEAAARAVPGAGQIQSISTAAWDGLSEGAYFASNGFEGEKRGTDFWLSAEVAVRDPDGRRPEASAASGSRFFAALESAEVVGRRAAERALARLGSTRGESAVLPMVVEARVAGKLVGQLLGPLHGAPLQQQRSFLEGRMGQAIGTPLLDLHDDPLIPRGFGSRHFDGEGLASRPRPVVERGVLRSWYLDTYYARKLGLPPTTGRPSNLIWRCGDRPRQALLAEVGEGVLVSGFLGGNSNGTTGDFSLGVRGFRIRGGQVAEPVGEMNVSGNHRELWNRLVAVGDDPYPYSSMRTPTLVFEGVQFSGG
jgi:PmbA protein